MNFLKKVEKKLGKYAIPHLTRYIIATYVAGYILLAIGGSGGTALQLLTLSPSLILRGQVWRIVSWVLIPPSGISIFTVFMLFFYYSIGTQLERAWGDFLYNVYIFTGLILTIIGAFVLYAFTKPIDYGMLFSTYYISLSLILGFAMTYPDYQVLFYFFIPLKMKWLAIVDLAFLAYEVFRYARLGYALPILVIIGCSLANALIFFLATRRSRGAGPRTGTQQQWRRTMQGGSPFGRTGNTQRPYGNPGNPYGNPSGNSGNTGNSGNAGNSGKATGRPAGGWTSWGHASTDSAGSKPTQARHRCAVCGRTELDNPDLEFRYCTKCKGYFEYCQDHLFTHTHKQ